MRIWRAIHRKAEGLPSAPTNHARVGASRQWVRREHVSRGKAQRVVSAEACFGCRLAIVSFPRPTAGQGGVMQAKGQRGPLSRSNASSPRVRHRMLTPPLLPLQLLDPVEIWQICQSTRVNGVKIQSSGPVIVVDHTPSRASSAVRPCTHPLAGDPLACARPCDLVCWRNSTSSPGQLAPSCIAKGNAKHRPHVSQPPQDDAIADANTGATAALHVEVSCKTLLPSKCLGPANSKFVAAGARANTRCEQRELKCRSAINMLATVPAGCLGERVRVLGSSNCGDSAHLSILRATLQKNGA